MRFSPVVCALDLAPESHPALAAAAELATRTGSAPHLVTVRPPPDADAYRAPSDPEAGTRALVEVFVDRALGVGACAAMAPELAVARDDDAAASVVAYAEAAGAGVLVLGTHARQGMQRLRLGSVAEEILRRAPCPVLLVPNTAAGRLPGPDHPVLVGVDFSEHSRHALAAAADFADLFGARVDALFVVESLAQTARAAVSSLSSATLVLGAPSTPPSEAEVLNFARLAGAENATAHVVEGSAAASIAERADALSAGAVAMGTHGRSGLSRALFGSVTEAALRRLHCPLLITRRAAS